MKKLAISITTQFNKIDISKDNEHKNIYTNIKNVSNILKNITQIKNNKQNKITRKFSKNKSGYRPTKFGI